MPRSWLTRQRPPKPTSLAIKLCRKNYSDYAVQLVPFSLDSHAMPVDLWVGAVATLAGGLLGGAISFVLSRQQIIEARRQRADEARLQTDRRSEDRRYAAYADFFTRARAYRNAIRPLARGRAHKLNIEHISELAAAADAASSLVFLVVENSLTYEACRAVVIAIGASQEALGNLAALPNEKRGRELNDEMSLRMRHFQAAAREELEVKGLDRSHILGRYNSTSHT